MAASDDPFAQYLPKTAAKAAAETAVGGSAAAGGAAGSAGQDDPFAQYLPGGGAAKAQAQATAVAKPSQPYSWGQMGSDALRDYLDAFTFGAGDWAIGHLTGEDEAKKTEEAKSRLGLLSLAPEIAGYMTNPIGELGIAGRVAGKAAPYVGRFAAGMLGAGAEGAAATAASDIGHGDVSTLPTDVALGGVLGSAGGLIGGVGRGAAASAGPSLSDLQAAKNAAAQTAKGITHDGDSLATALTGPTYGMDQSMATAYRGSGVESAVNEVANDARYGSMTGNDPTTNDLNSWKNQIMESASNGRERALARPFADAIDNHIAQVAPTSGGTIADAQAASRGIDDAHATLQKAKLADDWMQDPGKAPAAAKQALYDNPQFYSPDEATALQNIAGTGGGTPSVFMLRHLAEPVLHHVLGPAIGGLAGYEMGGGAEGGIAGMMAGESAPYLIHASMDMLKEAARKRAIQAFRATATGGKLVTPDDMLSPASIRSLLPTAGAGILAAHPGMMSP